MKDMASIKSNRGFTLIEILVAVFILAIGLLGVAGIQTLSVKSSANSNLRGVALYLANDMADRMRANPAAISAGQYDSMVGKAEAASCLADTGCTSAQMAANDKFEWDEQVKNSLPNGTTAIAVAGGVHTITITWTARVKQGVIADDDAGTDTSTLNFRVQL